MRVTIERNDNLNGQLTRAVRIHAGEGTEEDAAEFRLTPAQAILAWWGMERLERAIQEAARWTDRYDQYTDTLRCHADAVEWLREFRSQLSAHAKAHNLEVDSCR